MPKIEYDSRKWATGYALTFAKVKPIEEILQALLKNPLIDYLVYAEETSVNNYHHYHLHIEYYQQIQRHHNVFDEVLGTHPYIQHVGDTKRDRRKLWKYYANWDVATHSAEKTEGMRGFILAELTQHANDTFLHNMTLTLNPNEKKGTSMWRAEQRDASPTRATKEERLEQLKQLFPQ